jgi:integral membrane protein
MQKENIQNKNISYINKLKIINTIEGISFVILLFIAMPLKYIGGILIATTIVGMLHGVLFIILILMLANTAIECKFKIKLSLIVFFSSIIPFGTFYSNKKLNEFINIK